MSLVTKRLEKQVQNMVFMEGYSDWKQGDRCIVITKECIEWIKKELSKEYELVKKFGKYILNTNSIDTLIHNWAQGRIYQINKGISVSTKTYPVGKAIESLKKFNHQYIFHPTDCLDLVEFTKSLAEKNAKVFTFGMNDDSLKFLFDNKVKPSTTTLTKDMSSNAIDNLFNLTIDAFYELGIKFEKVQINSGYRSGSDQAGIMLGLTNIDAYSTTKYFIEYLRAIQTGNEVEYTAYYEANKGSNRGKFTDRIGNKNEQLIIDVQTKGVQTVLGEYIDEKDYQPSKHPYKIAYDIKKNKSTDYMYKQHKGGKSDKYTTHYHISVSK